MPQPTAARPRKDNPLIALEYLVGDWVGQGQGDTFTYREEATFRWTLDESTLSYHSRAVAKDGTFVHCEEGYLTYADREERVLGIFVYGDGLLELAEADIEADGSMTLETREIIALPRGKSYRSILRRLTPTPEGFQHEIHLTLGPEGPYSHTKSHLTRTTRRTPPPR